MSQKLRKFGSMAGSRFLRNSVKSAFGKYLLATNVISSGVLLGLGDLVQQEFEYRSKLLPKRYDYARAGMHTTININCIIFLMF